MRGVENEAENKSEVSRTQRAYQIKDWQVLTDGHPKAFMLEEVVEESNSGVRNQSLIRVKPPLRLAYSV